MEFVARIVDKNSLTKEDLDYINRTPILRHISINEVFFKIYGKRLYNVIEHHNKFYVILFKE